MGDKDRNPRPTSSVAAAKLRIAVLVARYNADVTGGLLRGAAKTLVELGVKTKRIHVHEVPGCFELPLVARELARTGKVDAVVALGCVIEGDTDHYRHICEQTAAGIMRAGLDTGVPVAFGVLTTKTRGQAEARARDDGANKGSEAAATAVETALLLHLVAEALTVAIRKRTRARELALQHLYTVDLRGKDDAENLAVWLESQTNDVRIRAFAADVATGCLDHQEEIDAEIKRVAKNWEFSRIAVIDRNILRLAVYEMLHRGDIPPRVSLNEAIELAKRFSTAESGGFVNALLDKIRADHALDPDKTREPPAKVAEPEGEMEDVASAADE